MINVRMKVIAFDLDGVIIQDPLGVTRSGILGTFLNIWFLKTKFVKQWYLKRAINSKIAKIAQNRKRRGEKIVIISATLEKHRPLVESWLSLHHFPYDLLYLRPEKEELARFKLCVLSKLGPSLYLEDHQGIVKRIKASFSSVRVKKLEKQIFVVKFPKKEVENG
jgi:hypothetical protein